MVGQNFPVFHAPMKKEEPWHTLGEIIILGIMTCNISKKSNTSKICSYEQSRQYFLYEGCTAVGIASLTSGAFLAGFASFMGASDEFAGIIGAIPAATGVVQLFSSIVFEKIEQRKRLMVIGSFIFRFLLSVMFLIPFLVKETTNRLIALAIIYSIAYLISSFVNPPSSNWIVDLTPEPIRGSYFAKKDAISLIFLTVLTIFMGMVMDFYRDGKFEYRGFLILGVFALLMTILDVYYFSRIKEPYHHRKVVTVKIKDVIVKPFKNRSYRKVIILFLLWNVGIQIGGPFFSIYMVTGLKLDYTFIMIMSVLGSFVRVLAVQYWGRIGVKKSWMHSTKLSIALLAIAHVGWLFININTVYILMPFLNILGGIAWAGVNISLFNIQFVMAPEEGRTMYLGASAALGGIAGFLSTMVGSVIVNQFKGFSLDFAGFHLGNMHIVFALSGGILLFTSFYVRQWMEKKE